ncbi:Uncharacterised protein [Mycobacteroides abscessus subsp. abscessus]|nr:Uncharacterised protein [Mycobacteroides abscessus subsp. abscessus]
MIPANDGDSVTRRRITRPIATRTKLSRNGIRQPHEANAESDITALVVRKMPLARTSPAGVPICGKPA